MKINLVSVEDGLDNIGFRKVSAFVKKIYPDTGVHYVTTGNLRSLSKVLRMRGVESFDSSEINEIALNIADARVVAFSSMTPYASITANIIAAVRKINPDALIVWGGIHAIIEPEDAIKHADAVCTGEGEFAFEKLLTFFEAGISIADTPGFWINTPDGIAKNRNLPLMTCADMDTLPMPTYQDGELIYRAGDGFVPVLVRDFISWCGLAYSTVWSIGCPMKCIYCGNSKFIEYDSNYRKIRHSSPTTVIEEVKRAIRKHPHISTIVFHDDNFIALPFAVLEEFCILYRREVGLPFAVIGLSPNHVAEGKIRILVSAGMNRIRMGIQSGSQSILDFYERNTSLSRIRESCAIISRFSRYMITPAYDIILDNPLETVADIKATLDMLHELPRPFTLNLYALSVIPNTALAVAMEVRGMRHADIRSGYSQHKATVANILVYLIILFNLPGSIYLSLRDRALSSAGSQQEYPSILFIFRLLYLAKRAFEHLRFMDFTVITGRFGYLLWRVGIVAFWRRRLQHLQRSV